MMKVIPLLLALAACGVPEKTHCAATSDCLGGNVCLGGVCQSTAHDACGPARARCAADATCSATGDGAACTCNAGFTGDGLACVDVNECAAATPICAAHAQCTNTQGSFSCACEAEFVGDGSGYCVPRAFTKVVAGSGFSCGLASTGGIYCWGRNPFGVLGDGTLQAHTRPVQVGVSTAWIDVAVGTSAACGLRNDHTLWCWGAGSSGQLGDGRSLSSPTPVQVVPDKTGLEWKSISVGSRAACALHTDGSAACWGLDRVTGNPVSAPVAVDANTDWTEISAGNAQCGLRNGGHLYCWGRWSFGLLGLGATTVQATPAQVGTDTWQHVQVGLWNACGIRSDGALLCWGNNLVADPGLQYGTTPQQIGTATDWQAISISQSAIAGLRAGGAAYAWGTNYFGELGQPAEAIVAAPTLISGGLTGWTQISTGNDHACGTARGQAYCWGQIGEGGLGDGSTTTLLTPTKIDSDHWAAIANGGSGLCGLRSDGALRCSGFDIVQGVGFGNTDPVWTPTRLGTDTWTAVAGSTAWSQLATCAIRGGAPYCWGNNDLGQLGIGTTSAPKLSPVAVNVPADSQWSEIAPGTHTCAIRADGALFCWGDNARGQLGNGGTTPTTSPGATPLPGSWLHVAVTNDSRGAISCGIRTDHTLWCWGNDQPPSFTQHLVPTQVGSAASWATLSLGTYNGAFTTACAVKLDGTAWCWGALPGNRTAASPEQVGGATDWSTVAAGQELCGVKTGGTLWCWGNQGLLGDGSMATYDATGNTNSTVSPVQIGSSTTWRSATGTSCGIQADGSLWCWGYGAAPIPSFVTTPVAIK